MDTSNMIFVFGSNEAGIHGAGAARYAMNNKGAVWGYGHGIMGMSYALPTKGRTIKTLPLGVIAGYVEHFLLIAKAYNFKTNLKTFQVTRIGCGLAGFTDEQIAPLFKDAPENCYFDEKWKPFLGENYQYWGTF